MNAVRRPMARPEVVAIVASGPSLELDDVEYLRARVDRVIAINTSFRAAPFADVVYASDYAWWKHHVDEVLHTAPRAMRFTATEDAARDFPVTLWAHEHNVDGLDVPGSRKLRGACGGEHAIHLAHWYYAPRQIILTGYDMGATGDGHWHGRHPEGVVNGADFATMRRSFPKLASDLAAAGVEVVNCTRNSALDCFRTARVADVC